MLVSVYVLGLVGSHNTKAAKGIDVSTYVSYNEFKCLRNEGYNLVVVRAYRSIGYPDSIARKTLINARKAGFNYIDV